MSDNANKPTNTGRNEKPSKSWSDAAGEVWDIEGLARYLKLSRSTVYKLAQTGKVPGQKVGRHWRFREEAIKRWLDGGCPVPPDDEVGESASHLLHATHHRGGAVMNAGGDGEASGETSPALAAHETAGEPPSSGCANLSAVLDERQATLLRERWIETVEQFLSIAATPRGAEGIRALLGLDEQAFGALLERVRCLHPHAMESPVSPGGTLGLRLDIPETTQTNESADSAQETGNHGRQAIDGDTTS